MTDHPVTAPEPWPAWLADLTPEQRSDLIAEGIANCYEDAGCKGTGSEHEARTADAERHPAAHADRHLSWPEATRLLRQLLDEARQQDPVPSAEHSLAIAALTRLMLDEPLTELRDDDDRARLISRELTARMQYAAGTLETITRMGAEAAEAPREPQGGNPSAEVPSEPVMELLEYASDLIGRANEDGSLGGAAVDRWRDRYRALVAEYAAAKAGKVESDREFLKRLRELPEAHRPVSLLPDGTFVEVQIKGHQTCEGYLTAGMWHGERYGFLLDKLGEDGKFVAAFPPVAGSVHLITAVPEPGSEPEQPDPWAPPGELESMRAEVTASRRLLTAQHLKIAALSEWAFSFLDGDKALAEVRAILERDFTPEADDAEPPF